VAAWSADAPRDQLADAAKPALTAIGR
jgi:hypothetical protein